MYDLNGKIVDQWFGGGLDLTPYYLFEEGNAVLHFPYSNDVNKTS